MSDRFTSEESDRLYTVTMLGSGTSAGVPVITCDCPVCTSPNPRNRRLRSSIMLRNASRTILVDCGSDFREQALAWKINRLDAILLTHAHSDHVNGLDDIRIYNWKQRIPIPIYATAPTLDNLRCRYDYVFCPPQEGGGVPQICVNEIDSAKTFEVFGHRVVPLPVMHGILPVVGFRIGDFAYITDASHVGEETLRRVEGVRYLILNALRHRPHPTHLNIEQATAIARRIGAEHTWFTHITHDLEHEETCAALPEGIDLGHDGLEFTIDASAPVVEPRAVPE
jgi:phosphoribosyl 1,2-cyclic phosphate phosphodiesterase